MIASRLRRAAHRLGIDVARYPGELPGARRARLLRHHEISIVFDVGANDGGFARELREFGYKGRLVSFEPLTSAFERLAEHAGNDESWTIVRAAVGDSAGEATINVAGNSASSSFLPMLEAHVRSAPESVYVDSEVVPIVRLDDLWTEHVRPDDAVLLKVDTQGFERAVLDGAKAALPGIAAVQLELSFAPLYEGGMLFDEAWHRLTSEGFELASLEPGFTDRRTGRMLQADGLFLRAR